jgi:hypothetical protein
MGALRKTAMRSVILDRLSGPTMSSDFSTSIVLRSRLSAMFAYLNELTAFTDPLDRVVDISAGLARVSRFSRPGNP